MTASDSAGPWGRFLAQGPLKVGTWVLALGSWVYLAIKTDWNLLKTSVWSVPFLLMIAAVSTPWRTVRWRTLLAFFMIGMGPVFLLVFLTGWGLEVTGLESALESWLRSMPSLRVTDSTVHLISPIVEEAAKVLPLLLLLWWRRSYFRFTAGPIDMAVIAGSTGAGLAFAEDIFVELAQGVSAPTSSIFALGLGPTYANLVGAVQPNLPFTGRSRFADTAAFFFPEMQELLGVVWTGHGALALGFGLAVGLAMWWSRRFGSKLFYLLPPIVYLWTVVEHHLANWYGGAGCQTRPAPGCTLASIGLHGRVFPLLVLLGWGYAIWMSSSQIRRHRRLDSALTLASRSTNRAAYSHLGWRAWPSMLADRFDFYRLRRRCAYNLLHLEGVKLTQGHAMSLLGNRLEALRIRERLQGGEPDPLPREIRSSLSRVAPPP